jgi:hypothetical protein
MLRLTMTTTDLKRIVIPAFSGLLIGLLMPPVEYVAVIVADISFFSFRVNFVNDGFILGDPWISIVFVFVVIFSLFLLAKFNKTLAAAALSTAIISTAYVIYAMSTLTPFGPP